MEKGNNGGILEIVILSFIILLTLLLFVPFLIPVPELKDTYEPEELADPDSRFVSINGQKFHVKTFGEGQPVFVLLHGFGANLFSWNEVATPLSRLGKVVAYDRPGFGLTERPGKWQSQNPYLPDSQAAILVELLDHFDVKQAILIGHSAGGNVALETALANPERVQALILVDPAVYRNGVLLEWLHPLLNTPQMNHLGALIVRKIQSKGMEFLRRAWHDPSKITQKVMDSYTIALRTRNWDAALWEVTKVYHNTNVSERLKAIEMPVLVLTGDDDRVIPAADSIRLAKNISGARLEVIENCGHIPHEEQPAAFMQIVQNFVNTLNQMP
jgi:pimeloyl-ACP methyl ester carboxylesterase